MAEKHTRHPRHELPGEAPSTLGLKGQRECPCPKSLMECSWKSVGKSRNRMGRDLDVMDR